MDKVTETKIHKISLDLLKNSGSLDTFPTPVDQLLKFSELKLNSEENFSSIDEKFVHHKSNILKNALSKVLGLFDRTEKVVYIDPRLNKNQHTFLKLHELGHGVLEWQDKTIQVFKENNECLDDDIHDQFEDEANLFAKLTLFQHDRFLIEAKKFEFGLMAALALAKKFGASNHAAIRNYVETAKKRCCLLVLKDVTAKGTPAMCFKRNVFYSKQFEKEFGIIEFPDKFGYKWKFTQLYYNKRRVVSDQAIDLNTKSGVQSFQLHFFNNTYNAFVLFFPKGENKNIVLRKKVKISIVGKGTSI